MVGEGKLSEKSWRGARNFIWVLLSFESGRHQAQQMCIVLKGSRYDIRKFFGSLRT